MIKEIEFETLQDYIGIVQDIPDEWHLNPSGLWYRGVNDSRFSLVPGCVWRGIDLGTEDSHVGEFLVHYRSFYKEPLKGALELYCLMQHYGMPTRLLDWTSSPLVALYFALENNSNSKSAVWLMSPVDLNGLTVGHEMHIVPKEDVSTCYSYPWLPPMLRKDSYGEIPLEPFAFKHPLVNPRISAQKGCFTFHGSSGDGIEKYFVDSKNRCIAKLVLSRPNNREEILGQLYSLGFKEDDIYQDLNSLSRRILREQSALYA